MQRVFIPKIIPELYVYSHWSDSLNLSVVYAWYYLVYPTKYGDPSSTLDICTEVFRKDADIIEHHFLEHISGDNAFADLPFWMEILRVGGLREIKVCRNDDFDERFQSMQGTHKKFTFSSTFSWRFVFF